MFPVRLVFFEDRIYCPCVVELQTSNGYVLARGTGYDRLHAIASLRGNIRDKRHMRRYKKGDAYPTARLAAAKVRVRKLCTGRSNAKLRTTTVRGLFARGETTAGVVAFVQISSGTTLEAASMLTHCENNPVRETLDAYCKFAGL